MSNTECEECESTGRNCLAHSRPGSPGRSVHDLADLPPLDAWTDEALVADFAAQAQLDHDAELLDESDASARFRAEILRRMKSGSRR